jgi:CheY-like chemotaxis protein
VSFPAIGPAIVSACCAPKTTGAGAFASRLAAHGAMLLCVTATLRCCKWRPKQVRLSFPPGWFEKLKTAHFMPQHHKMVLAVVSDLFFSVKITDAAKRAGMAVELVKDPQELLIKAKAKPSVIIFDLNFEDAQPLELIAKLKGSEEFKGVSLIGYLSHVQGELKQAAQEAGCDMVMAKSAFSQNLQQILKRHSGVI